MRGVGCLLPEWQSTCLVQNEPIVNLLTDSILSRAMRVLTECQGRRSMSGSREVFELSVEVPFADSQQLGDASRWPSCSAPAISGLPAAGGSAPQVPGPRAQGRAVACVSWSSAARHLEGPGP